MNSDSRCRSLQRITAVIPSLNRFPPCLFIRIDLPDLSQVQDGVPIDLPTCSCPESFRIQNLGDIPISISRGLQLFNSSPQTIGLFHIVFHVSDPAAHL